MRTKFAGIILALAVVALSLPASAQTDNSKLFADWQKEKGVYLTPPVKRQFASYQAVMFQLQAAELGFEKKDKNTLASALGESKVTIFFPAGESSHVAVQNDDGTTTSLPTKERQNSYVASLFSWDTFSAFLRKFATVQLTVRPAPPRDYKVKINGDDCDATDKGLYVVAPGPTTVSVTRPQKPICNWSGTIKEGKTQAVDCQL